MQLETIYDQGKAMLDKFEVIRDALLPAGDALPDLTPRQLERIEAFELRAQMREEQGRPI